MSCFSLPISLMGPVMVVSGQTELTLVILEDREDPSTLLRGSLSLAGDASMGDRPKISSKRTAAASWRPGMTWEYTSRVRLTVAVAQPLADDFGRDVAPSA